MVSCSGGSTDPEGSAESTIRQAIQAMINGDSSVFTELVRPDSREQTSMRDLSGCDLSSAEVLLEQILPSRVDASVVFDVPCGRSSDDRAYKDCSLLAEELSGRWYLETPDPTCHVSDEPARATPSAPISKDEQAIQELARRSIEALPDGEWASLYDEFTPEYQQRCPQRQFVEAGEAGAAEQGANLALLKFKRLEDLTIDGAAASGVIVGEIQGQSEYSVKGAFENVGGTWKIAPAPNTEGCQAFERL